MKTLGKQTLLTEYIITIALLSLCLFLYGFFPIKSSSELFSSEEDFPKTLFDTKFHKELLYNKSVGKTIIMIIDGIRVDFVNKMPYTSAVLEDANVQSCLLTARVSAPTVTLPRVKAIVTGTVSSFVDVVLNFDTKELKIDNIIHQATKLEKKVVFYGDDTWVKLFPHQFSRSDGTTSFYVNDYSEVDDNVTRHLSSELEKSDWDLMVLHYLGLDHIGHIEGPQSSLIQPKLREMDDIIAQLHSYLKIQGDGLLVVCGDHGMKDSGSHGGVSLPEILVPVIALGVSCPYNDKAEILQVDLAATLSVLWAAPLPADSIGVAVPALLAHLTPAQRMYVSLYNAQQLAANFLRNRGTTGHESYIIFEEAKEAHHRWLTNSSSISHHQVEALYRAALLGMSRHLSSVMANYDMFALLSSMSLLLQIVILLGFGLQGVHRRFQSLRLSPMLGVCILTAAAVSKASSTYNVTTLPWLVTFFTSALFFLHLGYIYYTVETVLSLKKARVQWSSVHWLMLVGTVLFLVSLFSSSFVEEEHQLWYFLWVTLGVVCVIRLRRQQRHLITAWVTALVSHRLLRTLNQTGDQWAHLPDLSDWLIKPDSKAVLSALFLTSIILLMWCCFKLSSNRTSRLISICSLICIYLHKAALQQVVVIGVSTSSGTTEARMCLLLISLQLVVTRSVEGLVISWSLLVSLLLRPYNVILLPALYLCSHTLSRTVDVQASSYVSAAAHHWLGAVFFFYQGNSNSLASVDVAAGYVGLEHYNVSVVTVLLLSHTYAMPVLAYLLSIKHARSSLQKIQESCQTVVFLHLLHVLVAFLSVTIHRYHLFVWTVFSPKLLYVATQTSVVFVLVSVTNICLCCFQRPKKY